jgi:hypothetical protein
MSVIKEQICCDCAGFDVEWMYECERHGTWRCRGCSCTYCDEELLDDDTSEPLSDFEMFGSEPAKACVE